jgi:hypothetical protein
MQRATTERYPKDPRTRHPPGCTSSEHGTMTALIELKLSPNSQFQDRPGACKLIETAVSRGDQTMTPRLCRAN